MMCTMKNMAKSIFLMGIGAGATIMYQKYSKPAMKEIEKLIDKTVKNVNEKLEEMM